MEIAPFGGFVESSYDVPDDGAEDPAAHVSNASHGSRPGHLLDLAKPVAF